MHDQKFGQRQLNSFLPCIALIDIVGGYEVPANLYHADSLRRVTVLASNANIIANDIYSAEKECLNELNSYNVPLQYIAKYNCSLQDAIIMAVELHDANMHAYEAEERELLNNGAVKRYLIGLKGWISGNCKWHRTTDRLRWDLTDNS